MVSPFMSFATGALQAVDKNIDRYRAEKAAEEERADAAAQRMSELAFQRETRLDVQELAGKQSREAAEIKYNGERGNKGQTFGSKNNSFYVRTGATPDKTAINLINQINANPEKTSAILNDAVEGPRLVAAINGMLGQVRKTQGEFGRAQEFGEGYQGSVPLNNPEMYLRAFHGMKNKDVLNLARLFSENTAKMRSPTGNVNESTPPPPGTDVSVMERGKVVDLGGSEFPNFNTAAEAYRSTNLGFSNKPLEFSKQSLLKKLHTNGVTEDEAKNRIFRAASNKSLMTVISGTLAPSQKQKDEALEYVLNPDNGFTDKDTGELNINNFSQFVDLFGRKMAGSTMLGSDPAEIKFQGNETSAQKKELESTMVLGSTARAARLVSKEMRINIERSGAGGSIIQRATALTAEIPEFIQSSGQVLNSIMRDRGLGNNIMIDAANRKVKAISQKAQDRFTNTAAKAEKARINFQNNQSEANQEALAASKLEMLELTFAYQLTGILQGGTGGRTISDQDITRAMAMFRSKTGTVQSRLQKLDFIDKMLSGAVNKEVLFNILQRGGTNKDMFESVKNAARLFETGANLSNFDTEANSYAKKNVGEQPSKVRTNNAQMIVQSAAQIPAVADSPNYVKGRYIDGINMVLTQGDKIAPGMIVGNRYVINANAFDLSRRMIQQFPNQRTPEMAKGRETAQKRVNSMVDSVFDLITGEVVPARLGTEVQTQGKNKGKEFPSIIRNDEDVAPKTNPVASPVPVGPETNPAVSPVPVAPEAPAVRSTVGRSLEDRRASTPLEASTVSERNTESQRNVKVMEQNRQRALRSGSKLFSGRQ